MQCSNMTLWQNASMRTAVPPVVRTPDDHPRGPDPKEMLTGASGSRDGEWRALVEFGISIKRTLAEGPMKLQE